MTTWYKSGNSLTSDVIRAGKPLVWSLGVTRHGEVRKVRGVDCTFLDQDGLEKFSDGTEKVCRNYFRQIDPDSYPSGHDICFYCGADNGAGGEYRQGFDCCHCGGN